MYIFNNYILNETIISLQNNCFKTNWFSKCNPVLNPLAEITRRTKPSHTAWERIKYMNIKYKYSVP